MQLNNPFQMNDWEIRKFLKVVLAIQLAMWGVIGLGAIGLQIPITRQFIGFIYLTFVPGILILRILKLHKLGNIETLLYTVGLSIATLMFIGFFMNLLYPFFGVSGPISITPLIITISVVVLVLCVLCYVRDKDFADPSFIDVEVVFSPPVLFLCIIPFMAVLGTYLVNFYHNNILLMLMIVVIAFVALLIGFDKFIQKNLYPLAIWVMAISLIYHVTLISMYLNVNDVVSEYYISNIVINNSFWDWAIFGNYNAVLSNVILAPMFYYICNLDLTWVFKIIYPLLLSLVSLGVYSIFLKEIKDNKIAFLSSFLFISIVPFFRQIPLITKQSTAEFFFVLLLMLMLTKSMDAIKKSFLLIIFAASLVVSHYGTSYLFLVSLIFVLLFLYFTEDLNTKNNAVSVYFVLFFIAFTLGWYIYVTSSSAFNTIVHVGDRIANAIFTDFFSPESSRGMYLATKEVPFLYKVFRSFFMVIQSFIVIGILRTLLDYKKSKIDKIYIGFSIYFLILLLAAIAISGFAVMDPLRLFHLALFTLAPFSIIGGLTICKMITKILKISWMGKNIKRSMRVLCVFFVIFLLFNTGFVFEVAKDHPNSRSISQETIKRYGTIGDKVEFYKGYIVTQNVFSGKWLAPYMKSNERIYRGEVVQGYPSLTIYAGIDKENIYKFDNTTKEIGYGYVQLSYANVIERVGDICYSRLHQRTAYNFTDVYPLLEDKDKIYTNGGSEILWS